MVELIFLHLPKTGGSSILKVLEQNYEQQAVRHFERDECLALAKQKTKLSEVISPNVKVLHGHFLYSEIKDIVKRDKPKVVTFMRHPVSRVNSNFNWFKHTIAQNPNHPEKARKNEPIVEYIKHKETRNKMTRFLKGSKLSGFYFIGFLESFEEDVAQLSRLLGWSEGSLPHEKNRTEASKVKGDLTEEVQKKIKRVNKKDLKLYTNALRMFKK